MVNVAAIPDRLKIQPAWVCWAYETRPGEEKPTKVLYTPKTGQRARTHNSPNPKFPYKNLPAETWDTFDRAHWAYRKRRNCRGLEYAGIGYVFSDDDPFAGLDIDHCLTDGKMSEEAWAYCHAIGSYTEVSPSGTGVKVFAEAYVPGTKHKTGSFEFYDRARFFTVTGNRVECFQPTVEERIPEYHERYWHTFPKPVERVQVVRAQSDMLVTDDDLLYKAVSSRNGPQVAAWWGGDLSEFAGDESSADASLAWRLAFWTQDPARLERLMRGSHLARSKWDEPRGMTTWIGREVEIAIENAVPVCN